MTLEPRALSGAWQSDREHHYTFWRPLRRRGGRGRFRRGRSNGLRCLAFRFYFFRSFCSIGHFFFRRFDRQWRNGSFCSSWGKSLGYGLLASSTSAATTSAAAATAASRGWTARRRLRGCRLSFGWRFRGTGTGGANWPGFRLRSIFRLKRRRSRNFRFVVLGLVALDLGSRVGCLFSIEIRWLQRRRSGLVGWGSGCLFATLQAVAHPFTHARFLTRKRGRDQSISPA